jgi:hypothetical protein
MWRSGSTAPPFLTSALDRGKWSASHPGRFTPRGNSPRYHWIGGWVNPRVGLDAVEKRKIVHSGCPAYRPSLCRLNYPDSFRRLEAHRNLSYFESAFLYSLIDWRNQRINNIINNNKTGSSCVWVTGEFMFYSLLFYILQRMCDQPSACKCAFLYSDGIQGRRPGFDSRQWMISFYSTPSRPTLGPNQPPIQWVPGVKQPENGDDLSSASSAEIKKVELFLRSPICLHGMVLNQWSTGTTLLMLLSSLPLVSSVFW